METIVTEIYTLTKIKAHWQNQKCAHGQNQRVAEEIKNDTHNDQRLKML